MNWRVLATLFLLFIGAVYAEPSVEISLIAEPAYVVDGAITINTTINNTGDVTFSDFRLDLSEPFGWVIRPSSSYVNYPIRHENLTPESSKTITMTIEPYYANGPTTIRALFSAGDYTTSKEISISGLSAIYYTGLPEEIRMDNEASKSFEIEIINNGEQPLTGIQVGMSDQSWPGQPNEAYKLTSSVSLSHLRVDLLPGESKKIELELYPKSEGSYKFSFFASHSTPVRSPITVHSLLVTNLPAKPAESNSSENMTQVQNQSSDAEVKQTNDTDTNTTDTSELVIDEQAAEDATSQDNEINEPDRIGEIVNEYNSNLADIPDFIKNSVGSKTITITVVLENGTRNLLGAKTNGGIITEYRDSPYENPTLHVVIDEAAVTRIAESESRIDGLKAEWGSGIRIESQTFPGKVKLFFTGVGLTLASWFS